METIHYISDFTYFSGRKVSSKYGNVIDALKSHIKYIARKTEGVFTFNLNPKTWIDKARNEIRKRWDSRVALKFVMALPLETNSENVNEVALILQEFISLMLNVDKENISIAIHLHKGLSGNYNPHAHILVFPKDKNGKKLRLNSKDLSEFHRGWQKLLNELGFRIRKDSEPLPHLGTKLYYDKEAQDLYIEKITIDRLNKELSAVQREIAKLTNHRTKEGEGRERKEDDKGIKARLKDVKSFFDEFLKGKDFKDFSEKQKRELVKHFNRLGYSPDDRLAIVLVNHKENKVIQRFFTVRELLTDKILRFLRAKNREGYSVYASINVLRDNALSRKKEDFKEKQRRIYLDLDSKDRSPKELILQLFQYIELKQLPQPTHIVKSSAGNYQVYWVLENETDYRTLEKIMEEMNKDLGLDHTQDVSRVFRLPYFRNKKPNKNDLVLNIDELKVYLKNQEIGVIKATGESVALKPFKDIVFGRKPLVPKPLSVYQEIDISADIQRLRENWVKRTATKKKKEQRRQENPLNGYVDKVADYWLIVQDILNDVRDYIRISEDRLRELRKLIEIAFERNKIKSPSEVDLAILGLVFSRYEGTPPDDLLEGALFVVYNGAIERGKVNPDDYIKRTYNSVKSYWEQRISEMNNNNDNDDDFGLGL